MHCHFKRASLTVATLAWASCGAAQVGRIQIDPSIIERSLTKPLETSPRPDATLVTGTSRVAYQRLNKAPLIASSVIVDGGAQVSRDGFSDTILPFLGRDLKADDLSQLAAAIASAARNAGFPFATAWIEPQSMANGVLRVELDPGTLAAVRVIGAINPQADRVLTRALVTGRAVRRGDVERAILLVGDIPGILVKESKYIRQDGFGILLVTVAEDKASLYAQIDNRGSKEVGPLRSSVLGNLRGLLIPGDEFGLISAQTPAHASEFVFVRGRYTLPVDSRGTTISVSASFGRANPGAALKPLRVIGKSVDAAISFSTPLLRLRSQSLWSTLELRGLRTNQTLLSSPLRNERLVSLTAAVNADAKVGPGTIRGGLAIVSGLPVPGVTHEGDLRISRADGDARYVVLGYDLDWTVQATKRTSLVLASQGQVASRPLLATAEIGAGGPTFGRAYDYAERTGDNGMLGSAEIRFDLGQVVPGVFSRVQFYGSIDGGYVSNLRQGTGGGTLLSTAAGARLGQGSFDGMMEIAFPLNKDRFDTGNRRPRITFRLSRMF
jgi:hemolysin activation/secretion protein